MRGRARRQPARRFTGGLFYGAAAATLPSAFVFSAASRANGSNLRQPPCGGAPPASRHPIEPAARCRRDGRSGLKLAALTLARWHDFGSVDNEAHRRSLILGFFEFDITHLDPAANYGLPPGSAEVTIGHILHADRAAYRDEIIISTKASYTMSPWPYKDGGSGKIVALLSDPIFQRMRRENLDIFIQPARLRNAHRRNHDRHRPRRPQRRDGRRGTL